MLYIWCNVAIDSRIICYTQLIGTSKKQSMDQKSPYFNFDEEIEITSINQLLELSKKVRHGSSDYHQILKENPLLVNPHLLPYHETTGIFRGQSNDWPLIPSSYRNLKIETKSDMNEVEKSYEFSKCNRDFNTFRGMASQENSSFPKSHIEQMCIAQHYGINTPLLDWTTNIFVAAYFALDLKGDDDNNKNLMPFIYHIKDERWLKTGIESEREIKLVDYSALVTALPIDRRIERQFSVFSFHPQPNLKPQKIPVTKYIISGNLFMELWKIMEGIGFSSPHLFPDYAGLVDRIKKGYMI